VIFATVGTHQQPFQRFLDALDALGTPGGEELVVQYGAGEPPAGAARAEPFMPFDRMLECFRAAERVITHAGVGSVLCATREGHVPLVVPRRPELGEHVDGHQSELTEALGSKGVVIPVWEVEELPALLAAAPSRAEAAERREPELCGAVRAALLG
jgi:UDP-N-acetylglucosamine transferase subunit ALG13